MSLSSKVRAIVPVVKMHFDLRDYRTLDLNSIRQGRSH
mgnify:CR=1 FL=1